MTRPMVALFAVLPAILAAMLSLGSPVAASTESDADSESDGAVESGSSLADRIQILDVEETEDRVTLEVAVPPAIGRLAPVGDNFAVTDGGQLVDLTVSPIDIATDTVLVIDTSGSMQGSALAAAKEAARSFIESLPADADIGLISFGDTVEIERAPTLDRDALLADVDGLAATGEETILWDALSEAADLVGSSDAERTAVVVLSDGDDTASEATPADAVSRLSSQSVLLYAVAIESPDTNLAALEDIVAEVGGQFLATSDVGQLDSLYTDIAGRLANRYVLQFQPVQQGTRTVVVSVATETSVATAKAVLEGDGTTPPTTTEAGGPAAPLINVDDQPVLGAVPAPVPGRFADPSMFWFGLAAMFSAFVIAAFLIGRPTAQVRLDAAAGADRLGGINARLGQAADRLISTHDSGKRFDSRLEAANVNLRPGEFLMGWLLVTTVLALLFWALGGFVMAVLLFPISAAVALMILSIKADRLRSAFADQLTETLGILASSLRAGQSLPRSVELVASEAPSPTAEQFHRISFEVRVGRDLTDSIRDAAERMRSQDLEWLAQAVDINRELGGDLTEVLDNVAATIRERRTVARQIDALSAEGRMTGWVLLAMPVVLFLFSWWRTPASIDAMLTEPLGRLLLGIAVTGMVVGHVWIRHLVKLKF